MHWTVLGNVVWDALWNIPWMVKSFVKHIMEWTRGLMTKWIVLMYIRMGTTITSTTACPWWDLATSSNWMSRPPWQQHTIEHISRYSLPLSWYPSVYLFLSHGYWYKWTTQLSIYSHINYLFVGDILYAFVHTSSTSSNQAYVQLRTYLQMLMSRWLYCMWTFFSYFPTRSFLHFLVLPISSLLALSWQVCICGYAYLLAPFTRVWFTTTIHAGICMWIISLLTAHECGN